MLRYYLCSFEHTQQNLSSEHSMIMCLHRYSLVILSCHFRYFNVILLGLENFNILLCRLQIRCIFNVLMHVVNHFYRWWIRVGWRHFIVEPRRWRYEWKNVCDDMTHIGTCFSNSPWTTRRQRREHHINVAFSTEYCDHCLGEVQKYCKCGQVTFKWGHRMSREFGDCVNSRVFWSKTILNFIEYVLNFTEVV